MAAGVVPLSNFEADAPAPVGEHQGMGPFGTFDTAGNVSEWCWNASGSERYLLGGSWSDPGYTFGHAQVRDPFDRSVANGVRCVRYLDSDGVPAKAGSPVEFLARDYRRETPVSNAVFEVYREQFAYDATPLNADVEQDVVASEHWVAEKVTLDAAYGDERLVVYLVLPKGSQPPYQTVIHFPGSTAINRGELEDFLRRNGLYYDFIVKSGRAFVWPIYKSTYDRRNGLPTTWPDMSRGYVDRVVQWVQDFGRTVDYLETRDDIDGDKLAYLGMSWGGRLAAIIPAIEDRLAVNISYSGGLASGRARPEVDQINYVTRVTIQTLMLNGRLDSIEPVAEAQIPMYELLGTPDEHKRHVTYDSGHGMPLNPVIRETLDWLDRYLGPVEN